jgi:transcriptional/translational regulatory protein YebC/TACO1
MSGVQVHLTAKIIDNVTYQREYDGSKICVKASARLQDIVFTKEECTSIYLAHKQNALDKLIQEYVKNVKETVENMVKTYIENVEVVKQALKASGVTEVEYEIDIEPEEVDDIDEDDVDEDGW